MENDDVVFLEGQEKVADILEELADKVNKLIQKRADIAFSEVKLKEMNVQEKSLSQDEIPQLLLSRGLSSISLSTGEKIDIIEKLAASIPKRDEIKKSKVLKWLIENGGGNLIKQELKVEEPEKVIVDFLQEKGIPFTNLPSVNSNSFKAFLNAKLGLKKGSLQELELGDIPEEVNPYLYKETKIKK